MAFPIQVQFSVTSDQRMNREVTLYNGLTVLLGPNGSGKTHLLRGIKNGLHPHTSGKQVKFLSSGRIGLLEQYRSDFDGHQSGTPKYDQASFGTTHDLSRRHKTETLNGLFQTISERADIHIKIQERLRKLFRRDLLIEWDAGILKVNFARMDLQSTLYSSGREASGLLHLVGILAALYDDEVGALLLDEPEVSLHPQLQAFLLNEIIDVSGHPDEGKNRKIVIIAAHSTEMIQIRKAVDFLSLIFCYDLNSEPVQISANIGELNNRRVQGLIARIGQEHKLALFSKRPLLVEGPSDLLICNALSRKLHIYLEAAGSQLLPVIGKGQMAPLIKLLRLIGKEPVVLSDADGITDGIELINNFLANNNEADLKATKAGFPSATQMVGGIYNDFSKLISEKWAQIAHIAEQHPYWLNRNPENEELAKRRASFCSILELSESSLGEIDPDGDWTKIRSRLSHLLAFLEDLGCFFLRKGSIESYYLKSDRFTSREKPTAAADEIEYISQIDPELAREHYADIVRSIQFAAKTEKINESECLRDLLLAVAAPALARIESGGTTQDIQMLAKSLIGKRASIFGLEVIENALDISVTSSILDIKGLPLRIKIGDDPVNSVNAALKIHS
jgi:energy-coupling factor transporter ATP-binding protein EcfA2